MERQETVRGEGDGQETVGEIQALEKCKEIVLPTHLQKSVPINKIKNNTVSLQTRRTESLFILP